MATIEKRIRRRKDGTQVTTYRAKVRLKGVSESATFSRKGDAKAWGASQEENIRTGAYFQNVESKAAHTGKGY